MTTKCPRPNCGTADCVGGIRVGGLTSQTVENYKCRTCNLEFTMRKANTPTPDQVSAPIPVGAPGTVVSIPKDNPLQDLVHEKINRSTVAIMRDTMAALAKMNTPIAVYFMTYRGIEQKAIVVDAQHLRWQGQTRTFNLDEIEENEDAVSPLYRSVRMEYAK